MKQSGTEVEIEVGSEVRKRKQIDGHKRLAGISRRTYVSIEISELVVVTIALLEEGNCVLVYTGLSCRLSQVFFIHHTVTSQGVEV